MKRLTGALLLCISGLAVASPPLEFVNVTPKNRAELGFEVEVTEDDKGTSITMTGPAERGPGCVSKSSGAWILEEDGTESFFYRAFYPAGSEKPGALGYQRTGRGSMSVFIDYMCPPPKQLDSRRYVVSAKDFLVK